MNGRLEQLYTKMHIAYEHCRICYVIAMSYPDGEAPDEALDAYFAAADTACEAIQAWKEERMLMGLEAIEFG